MDGVMLLVFAILLGCGFIVGAVLGMEIGIYIGRRFDGDIEKCAAEEAANE